MKVKHSFVTNSSSSSFIVIFDNKIEDFLYVKDKILFIEKAEVVYDDCIKQKPILVNEENYKKAYNKVFKEIMSGYFPGHVSGYDLKDQNEELYDRNKDKDIAQKEYVAKIDKLWKQADKINRKKAKELTDKFMEKAKGKWIYFFHYSDNDGEFYQEMEHGDTFRKFEHLQISHH